MKVHFDEIGSGWILENPLKRISKKKEILN